MAYSYVQTFFVSSEAVAGSSTVMLNSISLYVKNKPDRDVNVSGLSNPSISVQICPADREKPDITGLANKQRARLTWDDITASEDASVATVFTFDPPISVLTNKYYGAYIQVSDDDYRIWDSVQGNKMVGTNLPSPGPTGRYDGYLFEGSGDSTFRALSGRDLKFNVSVARFASNTSAPRTLVNESYEFMNISDLSGTFLEGEMVFQSASDKTLPVPVLETLPGQLSINADSNMLVGQNTNFLATAANGSFLVLKDNDKQDVVKVQSVINSTAIYLSKNASFTSNGFSGTYYISPIAEVYKSKPYFNKTNEIVLYKSNANSTVKFVAGGLRGVTVSNTGAGYSNTNIVRVPNPSGIDAIFSVSTNGSGSISSMNVINPGSGFTGPTSNVRVEVSISDTSLKSGNPGANAVITVSANQIGLALSGAVSKSSANIVSIDNKILSEMWPILQETTPASGTINANHAFSNGNALGSLTGLYRPTKLSVLNELTEYPSVIASKSNEMTANSGPSAKISVQLSVDKPGLIFESPSVEPKRSTVMVYENDINNDATGEETNFGNARAKYIGKRITFDRDTASEDLVVQATASRPQGTDIKIYAKVHNTVDDEAFDDKAWTELERISKDVYTNPADKNQTTRMEFSIPQMPKVEATLDGYVTISNSSLTIAGSGTSFSANLVGRTVRIYNPLSPSNMHITPVIAVGSPTTMTIASTTSNSSVNGSGFKVDLLAHNGTAFNNILNDNVSRYYTSSGAAIDGFDSFAIKVVLLSDSKNIAPTLDDISMIGVSA